MEQVSDKNQVLSAIEQSIQNALSLFDFKSLLGDKKKNFFSIDDPIVSLHDREDEDSHIEGKQVNSNEFLSNECSSGEVYIKNNQQPKVLLHNLTVKNNSLSHESISFPSSKNSISKTIEEIQTVLNAKNDSFPEITEPSPEEILNYYSENLGISISSSGSPKEATIHPQYKLINNDQKQVQHRRGKNNIKQVKQAKSKVDSETKLENKKEKQTKSNLSTSKENRLKELMNVYGCSEKNRKHNWNSTFCSKSEENFKTSTKAGKTHKLLNSSSKISSAPSKRIKSKNKKTTIKNDSYFADLDLEKSTKLSIRKKTNKKSSEISFKKASLKRKLTLNVSKHDLDPKLNRNRPTPNIDTKNCINKVSSINDKSLQLKNKNMNKTKRNMYLNGPKASVNSEPKEMQTENVGKPILSQNESHTGDDNTVLMNKIDSHSLQNRLYQHKKFKFAEDEKEMDSLNKNPLSEEEKLNEDILFGEGGTHAKNNYIFDDKNNYLINEGYLSKSAQLHYALPTQSSRSKEVERFLNGHYQHLPFVIGQSTSKSHNLWVNIQEALSLIKQKLQQPIEPQNTALIDFMECDRPLSVISKSTAKTMRKHHHCPAVRSDSLYDIPEANFEIEETAISSWENHPECIKVNMDPNYVRSRCSCLAQPVMNYKSVLRRIFEGSSENASESMMAVNEVKEDEKSDRGGDSYMSELKKALIRFTQDFEEMNNKYEEMLLDPNSSKEELKYLEVQLENKEEEIKEIIARFNEVKELNDKVRLEGTKSRAGLYSLDTFKSTTSIRLAQTLRRVQQFKESLKSRPSISHLARHIHVLNSYEK